MYRPYALRTLVGLLGSSVFFLVEPVEGFGFVFEEETFLAVVFFAAATDGLVAEGFFVAVFVEGFALADDVEGFVEVCDSTSAGTGNGQSGSPRVRCW